jgi:FtsP/CotA-like multicopper oxidase with cupredoxin domain
MIVFLFFQIAIAQLPPSPFGETNKICPSGNNPYSVDGFPGSPFKLNIFTDIFKNPQIAIPKFKKCRNDNHCMFSYEFDIVDIQLRTFDKLITNCRRFPATWFLSYGGQIPGPTIIVPTGHESFVRFNNKIGTRFIKQSHRPCLGTRSGRPISVHLHGSASLAPFDGWAEDETCNGESKDYIYPNNRPATAWYHDHALHITADNAYLGLAGLYLISSKKKHGGCGEPWNLENIEEKMMILNDKVIDNKCQMYHDIFKLHKDDLYGDINMVNGIPFPHMPLEPKWYRFRLLNAAASRPYLVKLKEQINPTTFNDIGHLICKIIASDGGFRESPVSFPISGLRIGVAERYDIVCDFSNYAGKTIYLWNDKDEMMKGVPYFCYSHLISKITVSKVVNPSMPKFIETLDVPKPLIPLTKVLNQNDINIAKQMITNGEYHRKMVFGRSNGHWTINGETWDSFKIAATDIGLNTWELWMFQSGGGWFHPVHMHLVDFYILKRDGHNGVEPYEFMSAKDVFFLGPSDKIWMIVRFGPHKGDYMFHCHNLIHEDNDMMRAMRIINGDQGLNSQTAQQYIINPLVNIIYNNFKYADPMLGETAARRTITAPKHDLTLIQNMLNLNLYRIFYPTIQDKELTKNYINPWTSEWCPV